MKAPTCRAANRREAGEDPAKHARACAADILSKWDGLSMSERQQIVSAFRLTMIPKQRAGRKPSASLTAAYGEWKAGTRGTALFQKHISNWERLSRWRRRSEQRSLMDAIYSRSRRERAKQVRGTGENPGNSNPLTNSISHSQEELSTGFDQSRIGLESDRDKAKHPTDTQQEEKCNGE
jgi:hypothetical protein